MPWRRSLRLSQATGFAPPPDVQLLEESLERAVRFMGRMPVRRREYEDFLIAWEEADPELRPMVEDARKRLGELLAERD